MKDGSAEPPQRSGGVESLPPTRCLRSGSDVPTQLITDILEGRCIAFVGAGFSLPAAPSWKGLLTDLLQDIAAEDTELAWLIERAQTALDFEAAGQLLRNACNDDDRFERLVQTRLSLQHGLGSFPAIERRQTLLRGIPFEAVLTLNMDDLLEGVSPDPQAYHGILREPSHWWDRADWNDERPRPRTRIIKLHGDANGDRDTNPVVLARNDYRKRIYADGRYANFLRTVFATRTVLYLGFSFTDAYINELRSEVLSLIGVDPARPSGYAVLPDKDPKWRAYFRACEGIEVLHYDTAGTSDHSGFDAWLEAIHEQTAAERRISNLLASAGMDGPRIVWVDPKPGGNMYGIRWLEERAGAEITLLNDADALTEASHAGANLLITCFGYRGVNDATAFDVLARIGGWTTRPPVIVFADPHNPFIADNRFRTLSRGAWDYAVQWPELFELIERLFGRTPGARTR
ncbi:MAG: SIR2 family protein [Deltaproteobacteria bacterium]|nr:MAG: SIR2 family protein [Deltaproteobacteria bacterium]